MGWFRLKLRPEEIFISKPWQMNNLNKRIIIIHDKVSNLVLENVFIEVGPV